MKKPFFIFCLLFLLSNSFIFAQTFQRLEPRTIIFDLAIIGDGDGLYYVPPGDCAGNYSCQIPGPQTQPYSCEMPRDGEGRLQDFWIEIWPQGATVSFYLFCRIYEEEGIIYITRSDQTWQLSLPDPEEDILLVIPPTRRQFSIQFDRLNGRVNLLEDGLFSSLRGGTMYIIPFCETRNHGDSIGTPALRTANTGANTSPVASRTAANAGLNTGKVAAPATPGLSQSLIRFPNPISSSLTITRSNEAPADTELSLWSLDGRRIAQGSLGASDADYTFPTAHLPAGVYLLRVVSAGQVPQTYKIVKN